MIFIMKPDGTIMPSIPSPVYQGADGMNVIYLFAPSMVGNSATVAFRTPDGVWTEREPMTQVADLPEEFAKYQYCVWQYTIGAPIARLDGVVTVQFFFYANGAILPSSASSFVVGRGVPVILPPEPGQDVYEQILQAISAIQKSQQYGDYAARAIFEWRKARVDGAAISYGIGEFTYVPAGAEGGPNGKTGSFIKSLVDKNTQPPYVEGKLNGEYWEEVVNFDYLNEEYFSSLKGLVSEAEGYKDAAETAQSGALTAKEAAEAAQTGALAAKEEAQAAETSARESAQDAALSEGNAATSERNADMYEQGAQSAEAGAIAAKEAAEAAAEKAASAVEEDLQALKEDAQTAAKNAQAAEQGAIDAKNGANAVLTDTTREKEAAQAAAGEALTAKEGAENALTKALAAKEAAETAQREALTAKEEAQTAESGAQTAQRGAETAREQAQAAQQGAEDANRQAQSAAGEAAENAANAVVEELQELKSGAEMAQANAQKAAQSAQTAQHGAETARDRAIQAQEAVESAGSSINSRLDAIEGKIPPQASPTDQLATKSFVNSTVQTATANFRGNWTTWEAVPAAAEEYPEDYADSKTPTTNDYIVVQDASGYPLKKLSGTCRFKYSGEWEANGKNGWLYEYQVNETPLTAAQLEALNSGLSKESLKQIEANTNAIADETARAIAAEQKNATAAGNAQSAAETAQTAAEGAQSAAEAAQATANNAIPKTQRGAKSGVASLDAEGKVPSSQLPAALPPTGAAGGDLTGSYPNPMIADGAVTKEKCSDDVKASLEKADAAVPANTKGQAGGVASLGSDGKVPTSQLPASATGDYIPTDEKGNAGGVATLDGSGKVPSGQLPASLPPSGNAGGDLKGTYPNPEIDTGAVTREKCSSDVQASLEKADAAVPASTKGKAGGVATLDESGKVPTSQLPDNAAGKYIPVTDRGEKNGVASLDAAGKVPDAQLPDSALGKYIPLTDKGNAGGVASLGSDGKVPDAQLPEIDTYDLVIRNQTDFEAWYKQLDANTFTGHSVLILDGTYTRSDGNGLHLPDTLKQLHGLGAVRINVRNLSYNGGGAIWYTTSNLGKEWQYSIRNIDVYVYTENNIRANGFLRCTNVIDCNASCNGRNGGHSFYSCKNVINCFGYADDFSGSNLGSNAFFQCTNLVNCAGNSRTSYAFYDCNGATNCRLATADELGVSSVSIGERAWGGTNTNVDWRTCPEYVDHEYHIFYDDTKPKDIYGGDWEELDAGTFLRATGTNGAISSGTTTDGGSNMHEHIVGNVDDTSTFALIQIGGTSGSDGLVADREGSSNAHYTTNWGVRQLPYFEQTVTDRNSAVQVVGSTKPASTEPIYKNCHIWKRKK